MEAVESEIINSGPILLQFSFPRTGGHFLTHCIRALYDTGPDTPEVAGGIPWSEQLNSAARGEFLRGDEEVRDRDSELNPFSLYALSLRGSDGRRSPLNLVHGRTGVHGPPGDLRQGEKAVVLIRDPIATIYSFYRVWRDRWEPDIPFDSDSVNHHLGEYCRFYETALAFKAAHYYEVKMIRFRDLVRSAEELCELCSFLDQPPKLEPEFVWHFTRFDNFTVPQARTFYRQGSNEAWKDDAEFCAMLARCEDRDFTPFGYQRLSEYLNQNSLASSA